MRHPAFQKMLILSSTVDAVEETVVYLTEHLSRIVKPQETVLVCFSRENPTGHGALFEKAILRCGSVPVFWEGDLRWKSLVKIAFTSHASTIIGPPLVILGLSKIAAYRGVPLNIYNTILAGYPCLDWMFDGIVKGLDCNVYGCFGPGTESVVSGFSCQHGRGFHLRSEKYGIEIVDENDCPLPHGYQGRVVVFPKSKPDARFKMNAVASYQLSPCACGDPSPKLISIDLPEDNFSNIDRLGEELHRWSSILDCNAKRTEYGLDLDVVVFPGEQLPKFPSCAKLTVRPWNPEKDIPISLSFGWERPDFHRERN